MDELKLLLSDAIKKGTHREPGTFFYVDFDDYYNPAEGNYYNNITVNYADLYKYKYVSLYQASIQKTYYMISHLYNTFVVNGTTVTIPEGNYSYAQLRTQLLTLLNALPFGAWTISFDVITFKYTFSNATPGMYFSFDQTTDMELRLGFNNGVYLFSGGSLTSVRPINLQLTNVIVIDSNLVKPRLQNSINQTILGTVPDTSVVGAPVVYQSQDPYGTRIPMENTGTQFTIKLFDGNNRELDIHSGCNLVLAFYKD